MGVFLERRKLKLGSKNFLKKIIEKIANENEKNFGNNKLDCCNINKDKGQKNEKNKN